MTDEYPMRINKYLAHEGISTRRGADELIVKGKVLVNGRVAVLGEKVNKGDKVEMRGKSAAKKYLYYAYNKPVGVIAHSPQLGEKDIKKSVPMNVFPVGRLDKDSSGLIILTNDDRVTDRLLNPGYDHDKEYRVRVAEPLRDSFKKNDGGGSQHRGLLDQALHRAQSPTRSLSRSHSPRARNTKYAGWSPRCTTPWSSSSAHAFSISDSMI